MTTEKRPGFSKKTVKDQTFFSQQIHTSMPRKPSGGKRGPGEMILDGQGGLSPLLVEPLWFHEFGTTGCDNKWDALRTRISVSVLIGQVRIPAPWFVGGTHQVQ